MRRSYQYLKFIDQGLHFIASSVRMLCYDQFSCPGIEKSYLFSNPDMVSYAERGETQKCIFESLLL